MCAPSVVAEDWIVKGCHIHVDSVELIVRPDHQGGVVFKSFFTSDKKAEGAAVKTALEKCLPDKNVRTSWINALQRAERQMLSYSGALQSLANGRLLEFKFLTLALLRYEQ